MEKTYYFDLELTGNARNPVLSIKSTAYSKRSAPYPVDFAKLNVPISFRTTDDLFEDYGIKYFLDFEKSIDERGKEYNPLRKPNLMRVLSELEKAADEKIRRALCSRCVLKEKVRIVSENGLGHFSDKRFGNPRTARKANAPKILKRMS